MARESVALELSNVTAGYGDMTVLWDINLSVQQGTCMVVLGANGAGKSTLLRVIMGLLPTRRGQIQLLDQPIERLRTEKRVRLGIRYMTELGVFLGLTVEDNLRLGGYGLGARELRDRLAETYDSFPEVAAKRRIRVESLSGGQRKLVGVAKVLVDKPRLLVMDEPSAGLSPRYVEEVIGNLRRVRERDITLLVAEQNVSFLKLADDVCVIEGGHNRFSGSVSRFNSDQDLHRAFFGIDVS